MPEDKRATTAFTRKYPARGVRIIHDEPTIIFLTVCTKNKQPWLATAENHDTLIRIWRDEVTFWLAGRYVIMPDHLHVFVGLGRVSEELGENMNPPPLTQWVKYWKRRFTQIRGLEAGSFQLGQWDRRIRSQQQYREKWEYVRNNPVRHGLASSPEAWPFSGEVYPLGW